MSEILGRSTSKGFIPQEYKYKLVKTVKMDNGRGLIPSAEMLPNNVPYIVCFDKYSALFVQTPHATQKIFFGDMYAVIEWAAGVGQNITLYGSKTDEFWGGDSDLEFYSIV